MTNLLLPVSDAPTKSVGEVASSLSPRSFGPTQLTFSPTTIRNLALSPVRWLTATRQRIGSFLRAVDEMVARWCRDFFGEVDFVIGDYCKTCRDVHAGGQDCPRAMTRFCADCQLLRLLNEYGRCSFCNSTAIDYRDPVASEVVHAS